ncbi:hypothetical protein [Acanthopleuribacter pedis]|uniref:Uncharacterized protein n=1 Tax=Acanthopleuribacter pedis TaxID=442870 RepID=A0A8J7U825_9BACT|nr:hypothetical protein [Acanthopleuribacter pedis]MBO1323128.1 hypothetical protein [Acanthopleuribacter pedis]
MSVFEPSLNLRIFADFSQTTRNKHLTKPAEVPGFYVRYRSAARPDRFATHPVAPHQKLTNTSPLFVFAAPRFMLEYLDAGPKHPPRGRSPLFARFFHRIALFNCTLPPSIFIKGDAHAPYLSNQFVLFAFF